MLIAHRRSLACLLLALPLACETRTRQAAPSTSAVSTADPSATVPRSQRRAFGAPFTEAGPTLPVATVLSAPERYRDQPVTVEGHVRAACTRRGCWMEVAAGSDPKLPGCRVTFKDYGFFVPTDSAGADAKVQGVLGVNSLPAERVAHLESEGGQFPNKNADGSVDELRLVATSVELQR